MEYSELTFRDIYHHPFIVSYRVEEIRTENDAVEVPADANAALVYPYIDRTAGINLSVVAPAKLPSKEILDEYAIMQRYNCLLTLRPGGFEEFDWCSVDDLADVKVRFSEHFSLINDAHDCGDSVEVTRQIEEIDQFRHPDYPDDVRVVLIPEAKNVKAELVWMRLGGIDEQGLLFGELLNNPYMSCGLHAGSVMNIGLNTFEDGTSELITKPSLVVEQCCRLATLNRMVKKDGHGYGQEVH